MAKTFADLFDESQLETFRRRRDEYQRAGDGDLGVFSSDDAITLELQDTWVKALNLLGLVEMSQVFFEAGASPVMFIIDEIGSLWSKELESV